jgi:hypothetical protein
VCVLPGDVSIAFGSCWGFLHCALKLPVGIGGWFAFAFVMVDPIFHVDIDSLLVDGCCPPLFICGWLNVSDDVLVHRVGECTGEDLQNQILVYIVSGMTYQLFKLSDEFV